MEMLELISRFVRDEEGQGLAEYALILVLVAVAVIATIGILGDKIDEVFDKVNDKLEEGISNASSP